MVSAVWFPLVLVVLCVGYLYYRRRRAVRAMEQAVRMVKLGLFARLRYGYSTALGDVEATLLAGAVTDFIFSEEPAGVREWRFRAENTGRIASEAKRQLQDGELSRLVAQAVMAQSALAQARWALEETRRPLATANRMQRLAALGVRVFDIEKPSPDAFIAAALALHRDSNALGAEPPAAPAQPASRCESGA